MFLIEYDVGKFVDAEKIEWIDVRDGEVLFTLAGGSGSGSICVYQRCFKCVNKELAQNFVNNLGVLNTNIQSIRASFEKNSKMES